MFRRTVGGIDLAVWDHPAASEPEATVVLAHGWCLTHATWDPVIVELQGRRPGVRVVTYDQPGHGRSGEAPASASGTDHLGDTLGAVVEWAAANSPKGRVVVGGHSMGGMTVMSLAGRRPDLLGEPIAGALLVGTAADIAARRGITGERLAMALMGLMPRWVPGLPTTHALTAANLFGPSPDPAWVRATAAQTRATPARTVARYHRVLAEMDLHASAARLAAIPTLIVSGSRDRLTPARWGRAVAADIPSATLWVAPAAGHMLTYEATALVVDRLERLLDT